MHTELKVSKRDNIVAKAAALFRERGFADVSMRDLAQALDLKAGSLYAHISGKQELLREICFSMSSAFMESIHGIRETGRPVDTQFRELIASHIKLLLKDPDMSLVFFHEWRMLEEPYLSEFGRLRKSYEQHWMELIRQGRLEGIFKALDERLATQTLLSALNWIPQWYKADKNLKPEDIEKQLTEFLWDAITDR